MPEISSINRLRQIAIEIRALPEAFKMFSPKDLADVAGHLVNEAMELGAFSTPEYAGLRGLIYRQKMQFKTDWQHGVWLEAITFFTRGLSDSLGPVGAIAPACGPIADMIEAEALKTVAVVQRIREIKEAPSILDAVKKEELLKTQAQPTGTVTISPTRKRFRVALSFPGDRREFLNQVADNLAKSFGKEQILYDRYHEAEFARPNLDTHLQGLYHDDSDLVAVFLCAEYESKEWCGLEWRAIRDLIKKKQDSSVMLLRFDDTSIPGIYPIDGYIEIGNRPPNEVASLISDRLEVNNKEDKMGSNSSQKKAVPSFPKSIGGEASVKAGSDRGGDVILVDTRVEGGSGPGGGGSAIIAAGDGGPCGKGGTVAITGGFIKGGDAK